jgi:oxygen-independent coproporphyrinogen-3 oxidase
MASDGPVGSLYVHVPFCARKCAYCAFYSEASDGAVIQRYVSALAQDMEHVSCFEPRTIFFGGGTPSLLSLRQWETLFQVMLRLGWTEVQEWTVECNPATVSLDKARLWREAGVNRVSLGVQSLDVPMLERLGRIHTRAMAFKSYDILRKAGITNLNLDLMFGIPGQSMASWRATIAEALAMQTEHLACYEVIYEEDTPLFKQLQTGAVRFDEDLACAMYEELLQETDGHGLVQYEIANFARSGRDRVFLSPQSWGSASARTESVSSSLQDPGPGESEIVEWQGIPDYACRHNVNYWRGGSYYGLGPSASGYVGGKRYTIVTDTITYCTQVEAGKMPSAWIDDLTPLARAGEIAAFGLRMNSGWPFSVFQKVTGFDLRQHWQSEMNELVAKGWGVRTADRFRLTSVGLRFADAAAERFLL